MIAKDQIAAWAEEAADERNCFLMEVKLKPNNIIEVYVDSDTAVTIDDCAMISRSLEGKMDRDEEDFELSVLSYGLTGALRLDRQLNKYLGKDVEVKTKENGKVQGKLVRFDAEQIEIEPVKKKTSKKQPVQEGNLILERSKTEVKPAIIF